MTVEERREKSYKIWEFAFKSMVPLSVLLAGWVIGLEIRLAVIEKQLQHNEELSKTHETLLRDIQSTVSRIEARMAVLEERSK